jgi:hypothetical protein
MPGDDCICVYDGRFNGFDVWLTVDNYLAGAWHVANPSIQKMQFDTPWDNITDMDRFWDRYMAKYEAETDKALRQWVKR